MNNQNKIQLDPPEFHIPWIKIVFGIILGVTILYAYYLIALQTQNLKEIILGIDLFLYLFAFVFGFMGIIFFAFSWKVIAGAQNINLTTKDSISLTFVAYFFEGLVPGGTVPGDAVRAYIVTKQTKIPGEAVLSSIFAHRLAGMVPYSINGFLCVIVIVELDFPIWISLLILFLGFLSIFAFFGLLFASLKEEFIAKIIKKLLGLLKRIFKFWRTRIEEFETSSLNDIKLFSESMKHLLQKKRELFSSFILATIWWLCNGISFYIVIRALHFQISFFIILAIYTVVSTIRSIPLPLVGGFGLIELTLATLLQPVGVPEGIALIAPVLSRNVFWFLVACSSIFLAREYGKWLVRKKESQNNL